jgi:hypothetical protein
MKTPYSTQLETNMNSNAELYGSRACNLSIELENCLRNVALYLGAQNLFRLGTTTKCELTYVKILVARFSRMHQHCHNQQQELGWPGNGNCGALRAASCAQTFSDFTGSQTGEQIGGDAGRHRFLGCEHGRPPFSRDVVPLPPFGNDGPPACAHIGRHGIA